MLVAVISSSSAQTSASTRFGLAPVWSWIGGTRAVCKDTKGRVLLCGGDFMRARDEGAFPVTYTYDPAKRRAPRTARERAIREIHG